MSHFDFELVIKIGSMALIREEDNDLNYNIISRLAGELHPGHILISSGAVEILCCNLNHCLPLESMP